MSNTATIVILCAAVFESLIIIVGNIFTIFVFWKHRNRLKRTSYLLINLSVADLLVGLTEMIAIGTYNLTSTLCSTALLMDLLPARCMHCFLPRQYFSLYSFQWNVLIL